MRHLPPDSVVIAVVPPRRVSGRSQRAPYQAPRPRKLSPELVAVIWTLAASKSLRSLAADFGVSHQTIRTLLQERQATK